MTNPKPPAADPDPDTRTRALLQQLAELADRLGDKDAATTVRAARDRLTGAPLVVVVAGRIKSGKSSLLNRLLDRPGLLPVDDEVATDAGIRIQYSPQPFARVRLLEFSRGDDHPVVVQQEIPLSELRAYAALDPETGRALHPDVVDVEVGIDHPLLAGGLVLYDTPGLLGGERFHTDVTLASLDHADALLYSADNALGTDELDLLTSTGPRLPHALFVVTKSDLRSRDRGQVLESRNRQRLAEAAPVYRNSPWLHTSTASGPSGAASIDALRSALARIPAGRLHRRSALTAADSLVSVLLDKLFRESIALGSPAALGDAARAAAQAAALLKQLEASAPRVQDAVRAAFVDLHRLLGPWLETHFRSTAETLAQNVATGRSSADAAFTALRGHALEHLTDFGTMVDDAVQSALEAAIEDGGSTPTARAAGDAFRTSTVAFAVPTTPSTPPPRDGTLLGREIGHVVGAAGSATTLLNLARFLFKRIPAASALQLVGVIYGISRYHQHRAQVGRDRAAQATQVRNAVYAAMAETRTHATQLLRDTEAATLSGLGSLLHGRRESAAAEHARLTAQLSASQADIRQRQADVKRDAEWLVRQCRPAIASLLTE